MTSYKSIWFWIGFFGNIIVTIFGLIMVGGCTEEYGIRIDDILLPSVNDHEICSKKHYIDPYSKIEYCLPENFINMKQIHLYRVEEEND